MSFYRKASEFLTRFMPTHKLYRYGFNWSPMYRRTTAKVIYVSEDLHNVRIRLPISWKNRNYMNTIFGGSMFSATDPILMIQLVNILGNDYVVWDKSSEIRFKRPAKEHLYCDFIFAPEELDDIKKRVEQEGEIDIVKSIFLTDNNRDIVYCELDKTLYIADKAFYKKKRAEKG